MGLIEVVTGILPHLVTESNNNLCPRGGALNYAMQKTAENCVFFDFVLDSNSVLLTIALGGAPSPEVNHWNFYHKPLYHDSGDDAPLFSALRQFL